MKRLLLISLVCLAFLSTKSQTPTQIINIPGPKYVFVGSLNMGSNNSENSQKLIIKILGGGWFGDSNGETNYYISNRGGLQIRQVSFGGSANILVPLKAYQNGTNIDFFIVPDAANYTSFAVNAFSYGFTLTPHYVVITEQTAIPQGTDITSSAIVNTVTTTDGSGNVGIGTADTKGDKLAVNGKIRAREIKVENINWPDYVFLPSYKVPTLQEIEKYIKEKGHLPGIPSASEVKANGVDLGDMNAKLLQKIEELTLHLIEKNKQIEIINERNKDYEKRLEKLENKK
ncbi:hypothetical protein [Pedobacter frigoris]|uniref:Uncharacterized protein n=1 Tax=Pedobacter frigoris TaxID=2571272 RepID=A0A4U1CIX0_9SPHI|nr:hypothetical protein [Pedobacter frigoris]TKC05245.1 hypothetical protein FA047_15935 [Pedobacter frigoris]